MKYGPTQGSVNAQRHEEGETRLQGRLLRVVQAAWILVAVVSFLLFVVSLPPFYTQTQSICTGNTCNGVQVSPEQAHALATYGISLTSYAWYSVVVTILSTLIWFSVGWLIFWHKSDSWIALLIALQAVTQGANNSIAALGSFPVLQDPAIWLSYLNQVLLFIVFALFPTGHFVPRWIRWLVPVWVVYNLVASYFQFTLLQVSWYPAFSFLFFIGMMGILVVAQIYRYRSVSTPVQRQQTKWIVFAIATIILVDLVSAVPGLFNPTLLQPGSLYTLIFANIVLFVLLLGPVSLYIAIMRYRLYDIDVIINRTLVYGSLTAFLALIYFGLIFALQYLLRAIINQNNDIAIVVSTLVIAALFQPLRHRIQAIIDRRFYRRKYDAARTLAQFSATLRNEVDLATLSEHLLAAVEETMQPSHISLWLRRPERETHQNFDRKESV
ncbi:MAG TPA: hypothetical protein VF043_38985 [Ktedonobacteraceae bacterium]